jgi:hypothetical protein
MNWLIAAAATWLALGIIGVWLIHRYFVRRYGDGLPGKRWWAVLAGPIALLAAFDCLRIWGREDRLEDPSDPLLQHNGVK